jgi:hypothetical protein
VILQSEEIFSVMRTTPSPKTSEFGGWRGAQPAATVQALTAALPRGFFWRMRIGQVPTNNSLWASKTGNSECAESVTCDPGRSRVFGQPPVKASWSLDSNTSRNPLRTAIQLRHAMCRRRPDRGHSLYQKVGLSVVVASGNVDCSAFGIRRIKPCVLIHVVRWLLRGMP